MSAAPNPVPVLSLRDLVVEFPTRRGTLRALDGVSLDVAPGEILGLVGESGAGKSMAGAAVIGLIDPPGHVASGEIRLRGERIDTLPERDMRRLRGRRIGMVFQDPMTSLNPLYTIGDQLAETIRTHHPIGAAAARRRAIDLLGDVGIPSPATRFDSYPHQFSGGMRQRVVIALALAGEPDLVIADEPTTALDATLQAQIVALFRRVCAERGASALLISHDMGVITQGADRVAMLYAGRIAEIGPVGDVVRTPLHPYSSGLMGSIPSLDGRERRLAQIPGAMPRLDRIPAGCAFHPRCERAMPICAQRRPEPDDVAASQVACFLHTRIAA